MTLRIRIARVAYVARTSHGTRHHNTLVLLLDFPFSV